jgi:hypothetical protein
VAEVRVSGWSSPSTRREREGVLVEVASLLVLAQYAEVVAEAGAVRSGVWTAPPPAPCLRCFDVLGHNDSTRSRCGNPKWRRWQQLRLQPFDSCSSRLSTTLVRQPTRHTSAHRNQSETRRHNRARTRLRLDMSTPAGRLTAQLNKVLARPPYQALL